MSAQRAFVPPAVDPADVVAPHPSAHWFAPITTDPPPPSDAEIEAFVAWCATHPSAGVGAGARAARWALFSADWLLAQMRARSAESAPPPPRI